jgi:hypothetical protein
LVAFVYDLMAALHHYESEQNNLSLHRVGSRGDKISKQSKTNKLDVAWGRDTTLLQSTTEQTKFASLGF